MSRPTARRASVATGAAAVVGVVAGHVIDYVAAYSDPHQRAHVLAASGHQYWSVAVGTAAAAAALSFILAAARGVRRAGARGVSASCGVRLRNLVPLQLALFGAVELTERVAAGAPVGGFVRSRELWLGVLLQAAVSMVIVAALRLFEELALRLAPHPANPGWPPIRTPAGRPQPQLLRSRIAHADRRSRGPPGAEVCLAS